MSDKTARRYRDDAPLPSGRPKVPRTYRTRPDPFAAVWAEVEERLRAEPRLRAKTLFDWLRRQHPGQFLDSHRRTFERRVRQWRATVGPAKLAIFRQVHAAGDVAASDFTCMNGLGVTIARRPFDHLVYHFVLTCSNWESVTVCASESFEALADGLQNALWELGGVPRKHRSDSLSAAVNNLSATRESQTRYRDLLDHYRLAGQRMNARQAHENGDAESSHGHFKTVVEQALLLRGSRDFATRDEYAVFPRDLVAVRNDGRRDRFAEEVGARKPLPDTRLAGWSVERCRVDSGSRIHVRRCTYSVHSRLIGEWVDARRHADRVEIWYADALVDMPPRLVGRDRHAVHYRHVIDSLVRKPGAFARYAYRDGLFPTTRSRLAYDRFGERHDERGQAKEYLAVPHRAATHGEAAVDDALRVLLAGDTPLTSTAVIALAEKAAALPAATEVVVEPPDLTAFDSPLHVTEGGHGEEETGTLANGDPAGHGDAAGGTPAGTAAAGGAGPLPAAGGDGGDGRVDVPAVPGGADHPRGGGAGAGADPAAGQGVAAAGREVVGDVPSRVPKAVAQQMQGLRDGAFLDRRENVLVFGKPGSGKTHALSALGEQLVRRGRSVYFASCSLLVQELLAAKRDLKLERFIRRLGGFEALVIDDLGYVQQTREEMEVLFTLLAERYERGSVLLTSNLPFSQWTQIFKDPMTTAAAIARLVHHSVIVELNVASYRLETAQSARPPKDAAAPKE